MTSLVIRGDAARLPLPDGSVDLIVTSPPYYGLRSYTDGGEHYAGQIGSEPTPAAYIEALIECTMEWVLAHTLGRTGITIDRSADYSRLAQWRTTDPGQRTQALQVPKPPAQVDGQLDMFAIGY